MAQHFLLSAAARTLSLKAIYAEGDMPSEYQADTELNAVQSKRIKEEGKTAILKKKDPLPTAEQRKSELGF